jgi:hypothetical protein
MDGISMTVSSEALSKSEFYERLAVFSGFAQLTDPARFGVLDEFRRRVFADPGDTAL